MKTQRSLVSAWSAAAALVLSITPVQARLGETLDQCTARYGEPLGRIPASVSESDGPAYLFERTFATSRAKFVIRIRIELKEGKAWLVRYSGRLHDREKQDLLEKNKGEAEWTEPTTFLGRNYRVTQASKDRRAADFKIGDLSVIEVMADACVKAMERQRAAEVAQVKSLPSDWEAPLSGTEKSGTVTSPPAPGTPTTTTPATNLDGL